MYQRRREKLEETCAELNIKPANNPEAGGYDILINCTGVGMHDTEGLSPVTAAAFLGAEAAIDLIYVPKESAFLKLAKTQGVETLNGAAMLFYQAYYADCLFLNIQPSSQQAEALYKKYVTIYD
jgi:shikimate dehydrogenase